MYLLKPDLLFEKKLSSLFTFHYVSIKTYDTKRDSRPIRNLHSTMYLLKHQYAAGAVSNKKKFTFHYVSIKTKPCYTQYQGVPDLHSTMYLLKQITS